MRTREIAVSCLMVLALAGCSRQETKPLQREAQRESKPAARPPEPAHEGGAYTAGKAAYGAAQKGKVVAKKAGKAAWKASKEAAAGWREARREAQQNDRK